MLLKEIDPWLLKMYKNYYKIKKIFIKIYKNFNGDDIINHVHTKNGRRDLNGQSIGTTDTMRLHYRAFVCGKQGAEGTPFPGRKRYHEKDFRIHP